MRTVPRLRFLLWNLAKQLISPVVDAGQKPVLFAYLFIYLKQVLM